MKKVLLATAMATALMAAPAMAADGYMDLGVDTDTTMVVASVGIQNTISDNGRAYLQTGLKTRIATELPDGLDAYSVGAEIKWATTLSLTCSQLM